MIRSLYAYFESQGVEDVEATLLDELVLLINHELADYVAEHCDDKTNFGELKIAIKNHLQAFSETYSDRKDFDELSKQVTQFRVCYESPESSWQKILMKFESKRSRRARLSKLDEIETLISLVGTHPDKIDTRGRVAAIQSGIGSLYSERVSFLGVVFGFFSGLVKKFFTKPKQDLASDVLSRVIEDRSSPLGGEPQTKEQDGDISESQRKLATGLATKVDVTCLGGYFLGKSGHVRSKRIPSNLFENESTYVGYQTVRPIIEEFFAEFEDCLQGTGGSIYEGRMISCIKDFAKGLDDDSEGIAFTRSYVDIIRPRVAALLHDNMDKFDQVDGKVLKAVSNPSDTLFGTKHAIRLLKDEISRLDDYNQAFSSPAQGA